MTTENNNDAAGVPARRKVYISGKTYRHNLGLSCAFRHWRAESHCNKLHGYALQVEITFETDRLDERNWVVDFGALKELKGRLEDMLDHKTLVAADDPERDWFEEAARRGVLDIMIVDHTSCEKIAELIFDYADSMFLPLLDPDRRVRLKSVIVREHGANHAGVMWEQSAG
ncbi:MAG: 6-pyruvoyl tetrahydropterin synthase family protein [Parvularculaceae bacterium]